jgi:hypothetical protein
MLIGLPKDGVDSRVGRLRAELDEPAPLPTGMAGALLGERPMEADEDAPAAERSMLELIPLRSTSRCRPSSANLTPT